MTQYQVKVEWVNDTELEALANRLGENGWELFAALPGPGLRNEDGLDLLPLSCIFKRVKPAGGPALTRQSYGVESAQ